MPGLPSGSKLRDPQPAPSASVPARRDAQTGAEEGLREALGAQAEAGGRPRVWLAEGGGREMCVWFRGVVILPLFCVPPHTARTGVPRSV